MEYLRDTYGFDVSWRPTGSAGKAVLTFSTASSKSFLDLVAPYVHPSMDYKLLRGPRGRFSVSAGSSWTPWSGSCLPASSTCT